MGRGADEQRREPLTFPLQPFASHVAAPKSIYEETPITSARDSLVMDKIASCIEQKATAIASTLIGRL